MSLLKRIEKSQQLGDKPSRLEELRIRRAPAIQETRDTAKNLKERIQEKLISELDPQMDVSQTDEVRRTMDTMFQQILSTEAIILSRTEKQRLFDQIVAEILGFGPLEELIADETVSEIMVNGASHIFVERKGKLELTGLIFENDEHVLRIIDRIVSPLGRRIDESSPYVDARLPDGSRVNAIIPPLAINGPTLTIRKFEKTPLTINNLIQFGSVTPESDEFLRA
jgi:pilus assembly protein CpaF